MQMAFQSQSADKTKEEDFFWPENSDMPGFCQKLQISAGSVATNQLKSVSLQVNAASYLWP